MLEEKLHSESLCLRVSGFGKVGRDAACSRGTRRWGRGLTCILASEVERVLELGKHEIGAGRTIVTLHVVKIEGS